MQLFLTNPLLEGLNTEQERAVTEIEGPIQLIASAGSGKTTVLTRRIAYMIYEGISPESIFAVTFTRKAANEMKTRLKKLVSSKKLVDQLCIGTYHSICLDILKNYYKILGFSGEKAPSLCLENRKNNILNTILSEIYSPYLYDETVNFLSRLKNQGIYPEEFVEMINSNNSPLRFVDEEGLQALSQIYSAYQNYLKDSNLIDYDDILMLVLKLLKTNETARKELQERYKYLLVDEFQDVNKVQYDITSILAKPHNNFFVVGDDAQSIYEFRGADIGIILNFAQKNEGTKIIKLENNYRSTPEVINISNKLIKFNTEQLAKTVKSVNPSISNSVNFFEAEVIEDESYELATSIKKYMYQGIKPEKIAVIYRSHSQAGYLEDELVANKIPYIIHRNGSFYDLPEIQDIISYLQIAQGERANVDQGLERCFRLEKINRKTAEQLRRYAKSRKIPLLDACMQANFINIHHGQKPLVEKLLYNSMKIQKFAEELSVPELIKYIFDITGYIVKLEQKKTESSFNSINNLNIFYERIVRWNCKNVSEIFNAMTQHEIKLKESKGKKQAVQLMTIHTSKGMEFDVVYVIGLEDEILPHKKSMTTGNIPEERRLCYVAITRAKKYLNISRVKNRNRFGKRYKTVISRFWQEMTDQVIM